MNYLNHSSIGLPSVRTSTTFQSPNKSLGSPIGKMNSPINKKINSPLKTLNSPVRSSRSLIFSPTSKQHMQEKEIPVTSLYSKQQQNGDGIIYICKIKETQDNNELNNLKSQISENISNNDSVAQDNKKERLFRFFNSYNEKGKLLVGYEQGISLKILQQNFHNDSDINKLEEVYDQCPLYKCWFDHVYSNKITQKQIHKEKLQGLVKNVTDFKGNSSLLIFGASKCGKTNNFFGDKSQKGFAYRTAYNFLVNIDLLNQEEHHNSINSHFVHRYTISAAFFIVYKNNIYDLTEFQDEDLQVRSVYNEDGSYESKVVGLHFQDFDDKQSFNQNVIEKGLQNLIKYAEKLQEPDLLNKSHLLIQFQVKKSQKNNKMAVHYQKFTIARLADLNTFKQHEELHINDFKILKNYLNHVNNRKQTDELAKSSKITHCIADTCNKKTCNTVLVSVATGQTEFENCIQTLKFLDKLNQPNNNNSFINTMRSSNTRPPLSPTSNDFNLLKSTSQGNFKDTQLDQLSLDIENFIQQIISSEYIINRLSEKERFDWVQERELVIKDFSKRLDQLAIGAAQNKILNTENTLFNAQKILRRIAQGDQLSPQQEEIDKLIEREQRMRSLNRERSAGKSAVFQQENFQTSPSRVRRLDEIRSKEENLDKDFNRLLERYNKSKQIVDNLCQTSQQQSQQSPLFGGVSQVSPKKRISDIPNDTLGNNQSGKQRKTKKVTKSSINNNNTDNIIKDLATTKDKDMAQNLKRLKQTISIKENLEKEKLEKTVAMNRELKNTLKDYVHRTQELEEGVMLKDELLQKYELEIKNCQEELLYNIERVKEMKIKEDGFLKSEELLSEQIMQLKGKLARKKHKLRAARETHQELQVQTQQQHEDKHNEISEVKNQLEEIHQIKQQHEEKAQQLESSNNELQQELEAQIKNAEQQQQTINEQEEKLQTLGQQVDEFNHQQQEQVHQNQILTGKVDELKDTQAQLEAKILKNRAKHEEEKTQILEEKNNEIQKRKEKNEKLKSENQILNEKLIHQDKQIIQIEQQIENFKIQNDQYLEKISNLQQNENKISENLENTKQENQNLSVELERLNQMINSLEQRNRNQEEASLNDSKLINELKTQISKLSEENSILKDNLTRSEQQLEYTQKENDIKLNEIEVRLDQLIQEIQLLKEENCVLKEQTSSLKKQLNISEDNTTNFKEKYIRAKNTNKSLKDHIQDVENKVKEFMHERDIEQREQERKREYQKLQECRSKNKLKLLDDIQGMIRQHKSHNQSIRLD